MSGRQLILEKEPVARALLHTLRAARVDFLRLLIVDVSNQIRSQIFNITDLESNPSDLLQDVVVPGIVNRLPSYGDEVIGRESCDEVCLMRPDLGTLHILPYDLTHGAMYTSLYAEDGLPSQLCSRSFLQRQLDAAKAQGMIFSVGLEVEFILYDENNVTVDISNYGCNRAFTRRSKFMNEVMGMLGRPRNACGYIQKTHSEVGNGQFELVVRHEVDVMKIADSILTIRETVHAVAASHGYRATFLPKPEETNAGNGLHLHLSFSEGDGVNAFPGTHVYGLSEKASQFVAGIVHHLPALIAFTLPSVTSYNRAKPHCFSGYSQCWGVEEKECAVRMCQEYGSGRLTNVELKMCDVSANPYIALGTVLAVGLDGVQSKLELGKPATPDDMGPLLPQSLEEALDLAEKNNVLREALGEGLFEGFIAVKRAEIKHFKEHGKVFDVI